MAKTKSSASKTVNNARQVANSISKNLVTIAKNQTVHVKNELGTVSKRAEEKAIRDVQKTRKGTGHLVINNLNNLRSSTNQAINKVSEVVSEEVSKADEAFKQSGDKLASLTRDKFRLSAAFLDKAQDAAKAGAKTPAKDAFNQLTNAVTTAITKDDSAPAAVDKVAAELKAKLDSKPETELVKEISSEQMQLAFGDVSNLGFPFTTLARFFGLHKVLESLLSKSEQGLIEFLKSAEGRQIMLLLNIFDLSGVATEPFRDNLRKQVQSLNPIKLPTPQDLILFQLREVFVANDRAEQLNPPPSDVYFEFMKQQGYDKFWAESYWAAHWQLPSAQQGFEMLHRLRKDVVDINTVFNLQDLKDLLKRLDILPRYHEQLIKIAYEPFTRVDIRRMYKLGVLSVEQVKNAYLDIGYDQEHAENLTRFTSLDVDDDDIMAIRSRVISAFEDDLIDELTFDKWIKPTFKNLEVYQLLKSIIHKGQKVKSDKVLAKKKVAKEKSPSLKTLEKWYASKLIDETRLREELKNLKYSDKDIEAFVREFKVYYE